MASISGAVTQKDIAKRVGVTQQSVALALKGNRRVSMDTRRRVEQVATELGYDRLGNADARALIARRYGKRIKTGIIAVLLTAGMAPMRGMPFFFPIIEGIERYASQHGLDIYFWYHTDGRPMPRLIRDKGVDGVVVVANGYMQGLANGPVTTVSIVKGSGNYVASDDREGARIAVHHLAELGHKHIAHLGWDDGCAAGVERREGFLQGLLECSLPVDEKLIGTSLVDFQNLDVHAESLIRRVPNVTAIVCFNDTVAMETIRTLERIGLRVPYDVSVVGMDDISLEAGFKPALTSVAYNRVAMGARAAQIIDELADQAVEGNHIGVNSTCVHDIFPVSLVVRETTRAV